MTRADETNELAQDIIKSFDVRRGLDAARNAAVAKSKSDTHTMMTKFNADHTAMSKALKSNLAKDRNERKAAVNTTMRNSAAISTQCKKSWAMLGEELQKKHTSHAPVPPKPAAKATASPLQKG